MHGMVSKPKLQLQMCQEIIKTGTFIQTPKLFVNFSLLYNTYATTIFNILAGTKMFHHKNTTNEGAKAKKTHLLSITA